MGELIRREAAAEPLGFSGERLTGAISGQIEIEHYHRYLLARDYCRDKDVLDVASGEGYGAALLAQVARSVTGVELDEAVVEAARREFARPNLSFHAGDARDVPLPDASLDVVVSFETLEHLREQDRFLAELKRVLRPGGLLVISTPDRDIYSPLGAPPNPYHVLELTRPEFTSLLGRHFAHSAVAGQRAMIGSVIAGPDAGPARSFERRGDNHIEASEDLARATYLVALASDGALPPLPDSVYIFRNDLDTDPQVRREAELARIAAEGAVRDAGAELERVRAAAVQAATAARAETEAARTETDAARAEAEAARADTGRALGEVQRLDADHRARAAQAAEAVAALQRQAELLLARSERAEHRTAEADGRAAELQGRNEALEQHLHAAWSRAEAAEGQLADVQERLLSEAAGHRQVRTEATGLALRLGQIEGSTAWRASWPVRKFGTRHPRLARGLGKGAKLAWWTGTLQLPRRYRLWRDYRALRLAPAITLPPIEIPPPPLLPKPAPAPQPGRIHIHASRDPDVSILICSYGQRDLTLACLRSIAEHPPSVPFEVVVVDDAYPGPEDMGALREVDGILLLRNGDNLGFLRSCNRAARAARGRYLHLLNNDTELRPGSVDALLRLLDVRPDAGMAGSRLLFPDGRQQEAGGILWSDASGWNYGRGEDPARPEFNYVREVDYCSGASILVRRDLWDELGGFDEAFAPAYYEDADLAFRIRARGLKVLYEPRSTVIHHEGASHGTDTGAGVKAHQVANQALMLERWGDTLARENYPSGRHVLRARDRARTRKTILVIDHYTPEPDRDAGSRSMVGIMDGVLDAGWAVKFWPQNRLYTERYAQALECRGIEVLDSRWPGDFGAWMRENGADLDHLMAVRPYVAADLLPEIVRHTDAVLSFYGVDLHFARMRRQAVLDGSEDLRRAAAAMERLERRVWRQFDVVIYPSDEEAAAVRELSPGTLARGIVPFWFDVAPPEGGAPPTRTILFVAGFAHPPNEDAAMFLMKEIVPRVEQAVGPVNVTLAGSNPTGQVRALAGRDVTVTGYVTDEALAALYASHRVSVVPLRFGAGVKGKVVESLSHGLPLVTTSVGAQGIEGLADVVPVHDDADAIAGALAELLTQDAAWTAQSAAQLAFARRRFSRKVMGQSVLSALEAGEAAACRRLDHAEPQ